MLKNLKISKCKIFLGFWGIGLIFHPNQPMAQVVLEDRSHLWPNSAWDIYIGIIGATSGVLLFQLVIFVSLFFLVWRKVKPKRNINYFLLPSSFIFFGWMAYLYSDTFASVDEFLRLCETKAGFHGETVPKGSGIIVSENLYYGCKGDCVSALQEKGNISFVEGVSKNYNSASTQKATLYSPGYYRVTREDGDSNFCKGKSPFQVNDFEITVYKLPEPHCFHFEKVEKLTAEFLVRTAYKSEFTDARNIFGSLKVVENNFTKKTVATLGGFRFFPGKIGQWQLSRLGMDPITIAECRDTSGAYKKLWGIK